MKEGWENSEDHMTAFIMLRMHPPLKGNNNG